MATQAQMDRRILIFWIVFALLVIGRLAVGGHSVWPLP
jgi:hypothetical protein